jgi:hypothetical protein
LVSYIKGKTENQGVQEQHVEETRGGRKFHIEELRELHSSQLFAQSNQDRDGQEHLHVEDTHRGFWDKRKNKRGSYNSTGEDGMTL